LNIFVVPLEITFSNKNLLPPFLNFFVGKSMSIILFLELFLNFNTAYYYKGMVVADHKKIAFHYLKTQFFWHLAIAFIFSLSVWELGGT
jgi:hypothetical protein